MQKNDPPPPHLHQKKIKPTIVFSQNFYYYNFVKKLANEIFSLNGKIIVLL